MTSNNRSPNKRLFVGSLPYKFTEGELLSLFAPFGRIIALKIMHNQWGKSRGLGFVEFDDLTSAINAKNQLHNHQLEERSIIVDFSEPDPFLTPEGRQRHFQAQKQKKSHHLRQSVYDSRHHGSRIGAKFASRTRRK
jgi:RNA recognition motif-containing protein